MSIIEDEYPKYKCLDCLWEFDVEWPANYWEEPDECPRCRGRNIRRTEEYVRDEATNREEL